MILRGDGRLEGSGEEDVLLGGDGPDVLISAGGDDRMHPAVAGLFGDSGAGRLAMPPCW